MSEPLRNRAEILEAVILIDIVSEKDERPQGPVDFRSHHTLGQKAAVHPHRVIFPVLHETVDIEGSKERDILFFQIIHHPVAHADGSG